ncbi:hypothetical protein FJZ36_16115 [Candidatus Poribacteria bacterium]|nr:hypothetical protein [Candidatus Poribacteria bacterium]
MAKFMGRLGAIYAPNGRTDYAGVPLVQVGASAEHVVADLSTRIARAFVEEAVPADFSLSSGSVAAITKPVGSVMISGGTPPYTLSSAGNVVATLAPVGGFLDWTLEVEESIADVTTLGSEYRERRRLVAGWEAVAERFWIDESFSLDVGASMVAIGERCVVSFFVNTDATRAYRYVGFASVEGLDVMSPARGIVREMIRFRGNDALHFRRAAD